VAAQFAAPHEGLSSVIKEISTKQIGQCAVEELCVRHSVAAEKPSVEENSEGS
jgi:hypothetical protein